MASGAAALTLKLAAVAAVLALLVIPSLARCPSLGPAPPPPPAQATPPPPEAIPPPPPAQAPPPPVEAIPPPPPAQAPPPSLEAIPPPPPPPPLEAISPAPAPGPPRPRCDICRRECYPACIASHPDSKSCDEKCNNYKSRCDQCKNPIFEKCTASCTGSCDCYAEAAKPCSDACVFQECGLCASRREKDCMYACNYPYCNGNHCW